MYRGYKVIGVTPAGRKRYLEILLPYLLRSRHVLDEHHLWLNTEDADDLSYMEEKSKKYPFFKLVPRTVELVQPIRWSIGSFYKDYVDEKTIYVRFDDDICWMAPDAIDELIAFRFNNSNYFMVFPCIINNRMNSDMLFMGDPYKGRHTAEQGIRRHEWFFKNITNLNDYKFHKMELGVWQNINCISWFGEEFSKFGGLIPKEEEEFLSDIYPKKINKKNCACGASWMCHFSFQSQIQEIEETNLYGRYYGLRPDWA
jgi:hypothetical protein